MERLRAVRSVCWSKETLGNWVPRANESFATYGGYTHSPDILHVEKFQKVNPCASRLEPLCYTTAERYAWLPSLSERLHVPRVDRATFCDVMHRRGIRRLAFIGDSIMLSQWQSLWLLLNLGPLVHQRPYQGWLAQFPNGTRRWHHVACDGRTSSSAANNAIEILISPNVAGGKESLPVTGIGEIVNEADFTVLNVGAWYPGAR